MSTKISWKRNLTLAVTLLLLGGGAIWLEYSYRPKKENQEEQAKKVFRIKGAQVTEVTVADGSKAFTFKCLELGQKLCKPGDNAKWEMTAPSRMHADDNNVNSLISTLDNLASSESIDLKEETAEKRKSLSKEYGLSQEGRATARRLEAKTEAGASYVFYLGDLHPIGDNYFGMLDKQEDKVFLVPTFIKSSFDHDLTYWRDKKIITFSPQQVQAFELTGSHEFLSVRRGTDGQWLIQARNHNGLQKGQAEEFQGDIESVDSMISSAVYTSAKQFVAESKSDAKARTVLAGARPSLTLKLIGEAPSALPTPNPPAPKSSEKAPEIVFTLFEKKRGTAKDIYASASNLDPLYEVDPNTLSRLDKSAKDLRLAKLMTSMDRFTAKRLVFEGPAVGDKPLVLTLTGATWTREGEKEAVSADKVQSALDKLSGNRIREFLGAKDAPAGQEKGLTVTLGDSSNPAKRKVVFWKTTHGLYARDLLSNRPETLLVDPAIWESLPNRPDFFKAAAPAPAETPMAPKSQEAKKH